MPTRGTQLRQSLEVAGAIYEAALHPSRWAQALAEVVRFVGGSKGLLFTPLTKPQEGGFAVASSVPESMIAQWGTHYVQHDVWAQAGVRKQVYRDGNVVLDAELVPQRHFLRSVVYRELLAPVGIARLCCGIVFGDSDTSLVPTVCSIFRGLDEPRFREAERGRLRLILPHLSRAFGVSYRLRDAQFRIATSLAALDRLSTGTILLDGGGRVLYANTAARRCLDERNGLSLVAARLHAKKAGVQAQLDAALSACLSSGALEVPHFSRAVRVPRAAPCGAYVLQFAPLAAREAFNPVGAAARAIAFVADPAAALALDAALLRRLYGMSPSESGIAEQLVAGDTPVEIASRRGVMEATVRNQLRGIFSKTGTRRQAELVRLLVALHSES